MKPKRKAPRSLRAQIEGVPWLELLYRDYMEARQKYVERELFRLLKGEQKK